MGARKIDRTGNGTLSVFGYTIAQFDLAERIPPCSPTKEELHTKTT
jgi:hypothetical protein